MQEHETCPHCGAMVDETAYLENCCSYCNGNIRQVGILTQITVSRKAQYLGWMFPFDIILNGDVIGRLGVGKSLTRKVEVGEHVLMCKAAGYKTAVLSLSLEGIHNYAFEVRVNLLGKLEIVSLC